MGLDMTLNRRTYYGGKWKKPGEFNAPHTLDIGGAFVEEEGVDIDRVQFIVEEMIYWRKANAIHRYFVEHAQDGRDDCLEYPVSREVLLELKRRCQFVLDDDSKDSAVDLLPTQQGFFFGPTDYDDLYIKKLKDTVEALEKIDLEHGSYTYESSW